MDWRLATRVGAAVVAIGFLGSVMASPASAQTPGNAPKVKGKDKPKKDAKPAEAAAPAGPKVGDAAPDWTAKDPDGKEHKLSDYKGKIVVMDFWATWCGWCVKGMPAIQKLHEKYGEKGVVVLGMDCKESDPKADPAGFMKKKNYTYPIMVRADAAAKPYSVGGIPDLYVIGPDGKILLHEIGYSADAEETISKVIDAHLSEVKKDGAAPKSEKPKTEAPKTTTPTPPAATPPKK